MFTVLHKIASGLIITLGVVRIGFTYHDKNCGAEVGERLPFHPTMGRS